jgi:hypothetical protein
MAERRKTDSPRGRFKRDTVEVFVTYELAGALRAKRVNVPGEIVSSRIGTFKNRMGRRVHGVKITYRQQRDAYRRATGARVAPTTLALSKVVEVPNNARNIAFRESLPPQLREKLRNVS